MSRMASFTTEFMMATTPLNRKKAKHPKPQSRHKILLSVRKRLNKRRGQRQDYETSCVQSFLCYLSYVYEINANDTPAQFCRHRGRFMVNPQPQYIVLG